MAFVNLMDVVYPVGAVYLSTSSTSPLTLIGGTWTQVKGATLAATGANGFSSTKSYGGSLAISQSQLPEHTHRFSALSRYVATSSAYAAVGYDNSLAENYGNKYHHGMYSTSAIGNGVNFLPYHFGLYVWYRTA